MKKLSFVLLIALSSLFSCSSSDDDYNPIPVDYDIEFDAFYYKLINTSNDVQVVSGKKQHSETISIPSSFVYEGKTYNVVSVGTYAFQGCDGLKEIILSNGIETIEEGVFSGHKDLVRVTLPEGLKTIGHDAFNSCFSLKDITFPKSLSTIPQGCFYWCTSLTSIVIPDNITYIGEQAFCQCKNLKSVTLSSELEDIGSMAFHECSSLISIAIPDKITVLRDVFSSCENLQSVHLPQNLKKIKSGAFGYCPSLKEIVLPENIEEIESGAFGRSAGLTNVTCLASNVPKAYDDSFVGTNINNGTLYVMPGLVTNYKAASPWRDFANITSISD